MNDNSQAITGRMQAAALVMHSGVPYFRGA